MQPWFGGRLSLLDFTLIFYLLIGSCQSSIAPCPSICTCSGDLVDCSHQGLTQLPPDLPPWTVHLNLSYNKLTEIDPAVFEELPHLREVQLNHNELTAVPSVGAASSKLTSLSLHHNKIRGIEPGLMKLYIALETLDLSFNEITEIRSGCFPPGLRIKELHLGSNKVGILESGSFDTLARSLLTLRLSRNRISQLPIKGLKLPRLTVLELNRNRIRSIEGLTFQGLESLEVLRLQRNNISKLTDGAFWGLSRMQILHLEYNNLREVNSGSLYGLLSLQQLHLGNNSISHVSSGGWNFCQNLQELVLSYNNLTRLDESSFADLGVLDTLRLGHNSINHIAEGAFKGLKNLRILELDHNEISGTIEDTNGAFIGLESLTKLTLFGNKIKSVAKKAFSGLGALEHLNLGDNAIRAVQPEAFGEMKVLKELVISSESLLCDCHLKWLPQWLISRKLQSRVKATCAHPESLKNKSIFSVSLRSFVCNDIPKPQIIVQPESTMAVLGKDIRFTCSATSSSDSPMTFYWMKNSEILHSSETENFASVWGKDKDLMEHTSVLHLRNATFSQEGRYQCIISNHFGSTYSNKARLTVNILPSFTKTPRDITIRTGTTARLECAAEGYPSPEIAWQKDGGTDFPAARDRRMHVMPDDDVFFIMEVKSEDMGVYSCTAQNSAGSVSANATITILEMPFLVKSLEDHVVSVGATLALQCKASGSPPPRITWLKGDEPLAMTERHHFTPGNQLLVIRDVVKEDAGRYTCEMSNTLGTERAYSRVSVYPAAGCVAEQGKMEGTMTFGIITIAVVCSIVLTSLVWVCIIYQTRKKRVEYSVTNTDETIVPPDVPSYLSSQGICSSDGVGNLDVEACNVTYRRPQICLGCNSEACKAADGLFNTENTGYGVQVTCTDCSDDRSLYDKDADYCQQALASSDYSYQKPANSHNLYDDGHDTSCHQIAGTFGWPKKDSCGLTHPSNHERVASCGASRQQETEGPCQEPLLRSSETGTFLEYPVTDYFQPHTALEPLNEDPDKRTLLSNGYITSPIDGDQQRHHPVNAAQLLCAN
ncbi:leucine-rich repeats and immunoglobulin-like domains protein 1 [Spea bombifrons]|uniref:leucine-rich repeats and immunoglobulin-like domains protein 1 n=1 Tax=Spea bombifrons TaxID=233779 RepID=UPI00234A2DDD|nr:leucine-rich repeats and immunoglobulin-like domains protein 1 [Spea bombifrons]